ncbi:hypothetical protein TURU_100014 [Turdus rufiventris]|nr:hypothetical protein TURU_100014 [Turdus rufiventris]
MATTIDPHIQESVNDLDWEGLPPQPPTPEIGLAAGLAVEHQALPLHMGCRSNNLFKLKISCHEIKNLVLLWLDTAVDKEREQGVIHPPQSHAVPDGSGREGQMEADFRPVDCTPTREDRYPLRIYATLWKSLLPFPKAKHGPVKFVLA